MIYNQYPYNIYNPDYVNPAYLQQLEAQCQQEALFACLTEITRQANIDRQRNGGGWQ